MTAQDRALAELLRSQFPTRERAASEIARLSVELDLPSRTVHVISDVHGEYAKLRHIINNASGRLRPVVLQRFEGRRSPDEIQELLKLIFYPHETLVHFDWTPGDARVRRTLSDLFEVMQDLAKHETFARVRATFPEDDAGLFEELLFERLSGRGERSLDIVLATLSDRARFIRFVRTLVRVVRNLAVDEIVIAGDCYDRGPRADRVIDYLMRQPNVRFAWGNHDVAWIGAALGHDALIAHVLRVSLRYRRLSQLEEGYGITLQPLEKLVRDVYSDDPAESFGARGRGLREDLQMARMQKAAAVIQQKLEGRLIERNESFGLGHRRLLHRMNLERGTVEIDGIERKLRDLRFPTIDPKDPYRLSLEEAACLDRTRTSFLSSDRLWQHVRFLADRGSMSLTYDDHVIFHGCVPVGAQGELQPFEIEGRPHAGRALFDAFDRVVHRAIEAPSGRDLDLLWYLWCGPRSPLFGKDRITTFERDLVADKDAYKETKNAYFELIHDTDFCARILSELGADPSRGLIVNGHVPVKVDKGEDPLKRSGKAITIDGAFSEAYGDRGYTLVLEPEMTFLAEHHHFESVAAAVEDGVDIIPKITPIVRWDPPRRIGDTEQGAEIRARIEVLKTLAGR